MVKSIEYHNLDITERNFPNLQFPQDQNRWRRLRPGLTRRLSAPMPLYRIRASCKLWNIAVKAALEKIILIVVKLTIFRGEFPFAQGFLSWHFFSGSFNFTLPEILTSIMHQQTHHSRVPSHRMDLKRRWHLWPASAQDGNTLQIHAEAASAGENANLKTKFGLFVVETSVDGNFKLTCASKVTGRAIPVTPSPCGSSKMRVKYSCVRYFCFNFCFGKVLVEKQVHKKDLSR